MFSARIQLMWGHLSSYKYGLFVVVIHNNTCLGACVYSAKVATAVLARWATVERPSAERIELVRVSWCQL